ncbi:hypothetical protein KAU32_04180 [bacterium]|nr:hypothetical protein [bacterium]
MKTKFVKYVFLVIVIVLALAPLGIKIAFNVKYRVAKVENPPIYPSKEICSLIGKRYSKLINDREVTINKSGDVHEEVEISGEKFTVEYTFTDDFFELYLLGDIFVKFVNPQIKSISFRTSNDKDIINQLIGIHGNNFKLYSAEKTLVNEIVLLWECHNYDIELLVWENKESREYIAEIHYGKKLLSSYRNLILDKNILRKFENPVQIADIFLQLFGK